MSEKAKDGRMIQFRIPLDLAIKLEVKASMEGLSLNKYCKKKVLGHDGEDNQKKLDEIYKMTTFIFNKVN